MTTWNDGTFSYAEYDLMLRRHNDHRPEGKKVLQPETILHNQKKLKQKPKIHNSKKAPNLSVEPTETVAYFCFLVRKASGAPPDALQSYENAVADWHSAEKIIKNKHKKSNESIIHTARALRDSITKRAARNYQQRTQGPFAVGPDATLGDWVKAERSVSDELDLRRYESHVNRYRRVLAPAA